MYARHGYAFVECQGHCKYQVGKHTQRSKAWELGAKRKLQRRLRVRVCTRPPVFMSLRLYYSQFSENLYFKLVAEVRKLTKLLITRTSATSSSTAGACQHARPGSLFATHPLLAGDAFLYEYNLNRHLAAPLLLAQENRAPLALRTLSMSALAFVAWTQTRGTCSSLRSNSAGVRPW